MYFLYHQVILSFSPNNFEDKLISIRKQIVRGSTQNFNTFLLWPSWLPGGMFHRTWSKKHANLGHRNSPAFPFNKSKFMACITTKVFLFQFHLLVKN